MIKIKRTYPFWIWLMRFAYKRAKVSIPKLGVGIPSMRDPDNKCEFYTPRKRRGGDAPADCQSDGHYLCKECIFYTIEDNDQ
jgi:hypothetical protein